MAQYLEYLEYLEAGGCWWLDTVHGAVTAAEESRGQSHPRLRLRPAGARR